MAARQHACFWMDSGLESWTFLRNREFCLAEETKMADAKLKWNASQDIALNSWRSIVKCEEVVRMRKDLTFNSVRLDAHLVDCISTALTKSDFDALMKTKK